MHEQRLAIYRRDGGLCKIALKCKGDKCEWDNWAADHIKPWFKGGKTTVEKRPGWLYPLQLGKEGLDATRCGKSLDGITSSEIWR